jgi:hypothetical protein
MIIIVDREALACKAKKAAESMQLAEPLNATELRKPSQKMPGSARNSLHNGSR